MVRVLIADDQKLARQGFIALLKRVSDIEVVGEAHDGRQAVTMTLEKRPDIVLMDIRMPVLDGIRAAYEIAHSDCATTVLMLAMQCDPDSVRQAQQQGAKGFVAKPDAYGELVPAIRAVSSGKCYYSRSVSAFVEPTPC